MLVVKDLHCSFGRHKVLNGVSFELEKGGLAGLIGPSGGGKSTLVKALAGIVPCQLGSYDLGVKTDAVVSLMFQEGALFDSLSVLDNVAFPLVNGNVPVSRLPKSIKTDVIERAYAMLERVGLGQAASKMPSQLSGGMKRRASLARALVAKPEIVFLDDPTAGLDPVASHVIMNLITELHKEYMPTMIILGHDLRRLLPVVDRFFALFDGKIVFNGKLTDLAQASFPRLDHFISCRYDYKSIQANA